MNNLKKKELGLIRSRILAMLVSLLISFGAFTPLTTFAKEKGKEKNAKVFMHPLNKDYHATVTLVNFEEGKFNLTLESENGTNIYYNELLESPETFAKVFDFSRLEDGEYNLIVKNKNKSIVQKFTKENGEIKVNYETKQKPVYRPFGKKAMLILPNNENQRYSLKIISPEGDELYQSFEQDKIIKKRFDFSKIDAGTYTILASSKNAQFAFDFINQ